MELNDAKLSFHIEGPARLDDDVKLSVLIEKLDALRSALIESDHIVTGTRKSTLDYVVTNLSHSSPAAVHLTTMQLTEIGPDPEAVLRYFYNAVRHVRQALTAPAHATTALLAYLEDLVKGVGDTFERLWIQDDRGVAFPFDREMQAALKALSPIKRKSNGAVKGIVKKYSGVGVAPSFHVFLAFNDLKVKCYFPERLKEKAATAVEHTATVFGRLTYIGDAQFPEEVEVTDIRVHAPDADLPTLSSLFGTMPSITGDKSVADYLSDSRVDW